MKVETIVHEENSAMVDAISTKSIIMCEPAELKTEENIYAKISKKKMVSKWICTDGGVFTSGQTTKFKIASYSSI